MDLSTHPCPKFALQWRHNGRDIVSNHQPHDCLFNRLFRRRSLAFVRGPVNSPHKWPVTRKMFPFDDIIMDIDVANLWLYQGLQQPVLFSKQHYQMWMCFLENVSILWRHHEIAMCLRVKAKDLHNMLPLWVIYFTITRLWHFLILEVILLTIQSIFCIFITSLDHFYRCKGTAPNIFEYFRQV